VNTAGSTRHDHTTVQQIQERMSTNHHT